MGSADRNIYYTAASVIRPDGMVGWGAGHLVLVIIVIEGMGRIVCLLNRADVWCGRDEFNCFKARLKIIFSD